MLTPSTQRAEAAQAAIIALGAIGFSKTAIARYLEVERATIYSWANGTQTPQAAQWDSLVQFTRASVARLLGYLEYLATETPAAPILLQAVSVAARRLATACEESERLALEVELQKAELRPWYESGKVGRVVVQWGPPSSQDLEEAARPLDRDELEEALDATAKTAVRAREASRKKAVRKPVVDRSS